MMVNDDLRLTAVPQRATIKEWSRSEASREISTGDEIDKLFDIVRRIGKIFTQLWEHLDLN